MSTRCTLTVSDEHNTFHIYRHHDGYPAEVLPDLEEVLPYAWPLPRYEAMDFAAAIIRAWKEPGGGSIYCTRDAARHWDREWHYEIRQRPGEQAIEVKVFDMRDPHTLHTTVYLGEKK